MKRLRYEGDADSLNSSLTKLVRHKIVHRNGEEIALKSGESGVDGSVADALVAFVRDLEDAKALFSRWIFFKGGRV